MNSTNRHGASRFVNMAGDPVQNAMAMNEPRLNLPELTVSELSASLKRTVEDSLRLRPRARRGVGL